MARIRTVKPDYWGDPKTARLSLPARLLFIGLLTEADDEGRFLASGKKLAGSLFPNDEDVTPKKVTGWLAELEQVGFVRRYTVDGVEYAHIPAFTTHQKISHPTPSRLPNPSGNDLELLSPEREQGSQAKPGAYESDFDAWYEHYPRKIERAKALAAYRARRREGIAPERLTAARDEYARVAEPGFVKYPASFLAKDVWSEWEHGPPPGASATPTPIAARTNASPEPARAVLGRGVDAAPVWELDDKGEAVAR